MLKNIKISFSEEFHDASCFSIMGADGNDNLIRFARTTGNKNRGDTCSDLRTDKNPNPYPVDLRSVLSRTTSAEEISCKNLWDQLLGSSLMPESNEEDEAS